MRAVRVTAGLATALALGLIVLGALVRSTNSGLSCPDWPTCYGHWLLTPGTFAQIPDPGYSYGQVMLEWTHRLIAGVFLGPLILLLLAFAVVARREAPGLVYAGIVLVLLLVVQAGLGGLTVLDQNSPWTVALHLSTALLVLSTIIFLFVRSGRRTTVPSAAVGGLALLAWLLLIPTMASAAMMAKSGGSLACSTWPGCDGAAIPDLGDAPLLYHLAHRALVAATAVVVLLLAVAALRTDFRGHALALVLLMAVQVGLGASIIFLEVPVWDAVLHQGTGVLTFALLAGLVWRASRPMGVRTAPTIGESSRGLRLRNA